MYVTTIPSPVLLRAVMSVPTSHPEKSRFKVGWGIKSSSAHRNSMDPVSLYILRIISNYDKSMTYVRCISQILFLTNIKIDALLPK